MELLTTNETTYEISISGYHKRTPAILRYIADSILILIPIVTGILLEAPDFEKKSLFIFGWSTFGILFKFVTKFISEFPKAPKVDTIDDLDIN